MNDELLAELYDELDRIEDQLQLAYGAVIHLKRVVRTKQKDRDAVNELVGEETPIGDH